MDQVYKSQIFEALSKLRVMMEEDRDRGRILTLVKEIGIQYRLFKMEKTLEHIELIQKDVEKKLSEYELIEKVEGSPDSQSRQKRKRKEKKGSGLMLVTAE